MNNHGLMESVGEIRDVWGPWPTSPSNPALLRSGAGVKVK